MTITENTEFVNFQIIVLNRYYKLYLRYLNDLFLISVCISYYYDILNDKQYGFRPKQSMTLAIAQLVDKVNIAVENNDSSVGIILDLSEAFDTINHNILLYKLEHYGFRGAVLKWFKSYLCNRKQHVLFNNHI